MKNKPYIIAEIAQAHDGSLGFAHSYIDAIADKGVDAVKFQIHIAEAESSIYEPFRINFSYKDKTRYDYWKRMEFTFEEWKGLKKHCEDKNLEFLATPFSIEALNILKKLDVKKIKIGSGDTGNLLLLKKAVELKKELIISTGLSEINEINSTVKFVRKFHNKISLLHCTTKYPTPPGEWGLYQIPILKSKFKLPVGYSDHSGDIYALLAAAALGAEIFEFHMVFDKNSFGPDAKSSIEVKELRKLTKGIRDINYDLSNKIKKATIINKDVKRMFGKSLCLNKPKRKGEKININDLDSKKPFGRGIDVADYQKIIDKKLKTNLDRWSFLNWSDIE